MGFSCKPDYAQTQQRFEAFFERELLDRAPATMPLYPPDFCWPDKTYATHKDKWLDIDYRVACDVKRMESVEWFADALPIAWPNMGPEIFSAWCGCGYEFGDTTTWSTPAIPDWEESYCTDFDRHHPLFEAVDRYTDLLLEQGKGKFIVGLTDFHPGGDHLAALRDP